MPDELADYDACPQLGSLSTDNPMTNKSVQDLLHCLVDSTQLTGITLDSA